MNTYLVGLIGAVVLSLVGAYFYFSVAKSEEPLRATYFTYAEEELQPIRALKSSQMITTDDVYFWDQIAFILMSKNTLKETFTEEPSKVYAYLAVAQRDFYDLSIRMGRKNTGSFEYLSKDVLCLFFMDDCVSIVVRGENDAYGEAVSELIMTKIRARMEEEKAKLTPYPMMEGEQYWNGGTAPLIGPTNGHSLGWFIKSGAEFRAPQPIAYDSEAFKAELQGTLKALSNANQEQREAVVYWAGVPGTKTPPGQLLELADSYMEEHEIPLGKMLLVRSVVALAVADAVTSVFDSKYTYLVKRPFMMDPTLFTIMPTPNHPSYPSGHSTLSKAATTVLKHYFPEDTEFWDAKAVEAGMSRVWGGIHYMMDHDSGVEMGKRVGEIAIEKSTVNNQ